MRGYASERAAGQIAVAVIDHFRAAGPTLNSILEIVLIVGSTGDQRVAIFVVMRREPDSIVYVERGGGAGVGKRFGLGPGAVADIVVAVGEFAVPGALVGVDPFQPQAVKVVIRVIHPAGGRRVYGCAGLSGAGPSAIGGHVIEILGE